METIPTASLAHICQVNELDKPQKAFAILQYQMNLYAPSKRHTMIVSKTFSIRSTFCPVIEASLRDVDLPKHCEGS